MKEALEGDAEIFIEGGMEVLVINEVGRAEAEMQIDKDGLQSHANKVTDHYGLPRIKVNTATFVGDASKSDLFDHTLPTIYLTERERRSSLAWRDADAGYPRAYVSFRASVTPFGRYGKSAVKVRMSSGVITVLAHELSEMIVSPFMDNFTMPDNAGKSWRKEICDPTLYSYYMENINGQRCVFPDFVLPSFWDYNGVAPFSYLGSKVGPMVWKSGTYAWFKSAVVRLLRVQF